MNGAKKTCFVLMPISEDLEQYGQSHFAYIYRNLIKEAGERAGYIVERADDDISTTVIVQDILEKIIRSDLVICDLSNRNPNVMYELGVRHSIQKPVVLIKDDKTDRVFDIQGIRTFDYNWLARGDGLESDVEKLKQTIISTANAERLTNSPVAALPNELKIMLSGIQTFENRSALTGDVGLKKALQDNNYLDIIGLSIEIAITLFKEDFVNALNRTEFNCRAIIYDPSEENKVHYEGLVSHVLKQRPNLKREQVNEVLELADDLQKKYIGERRLEIKRISKIPLLYNLWVSGNDRTVPNVGHISVYSYDTQRGGPAFRSTSSLQPLLYEIQKEFNHVWNNVAQPIP